MAPRPGKDRQGSPPGPWGTAPVVAGRRHHRLGWGVLVLLVAAVVAIVVLPNTSGPSPGAAPPSTPPTARTTPPLVPFDVVVDVTEVASMDNDGLFGRETAIPQGAVATATRQITETLRRYLNAQFVTPETRFSDRPLSQLLSRHARGALSDHDRAGLGTLEVSVRQVRAEPVTAQARMLTSGSEVALITVDYDARARVVSDNGASVPLRQHATMVFVPDHDGWRAEAVDVRLDLPRTGGPR